VECLTEEVGGKWESADVVEEGRGCHCGGLDEGPRGMCAIVGEKLSDSKLQKARSMMANVDCPNAEPVSVQESLLLLLKAAWN